MTRARQCACESRKHQRCCKNTTGEYITIFDCDHVPTRSFLQMTMGAMVADPKLGMIQTPHHFYSPDPFERNLGIFRKVPNESALFYGIIQDGNDLWDATFFCGSCAVLRRTALGGDWRDRGGDRNRGCAYRAAYALCRLEHRVSESATSGRARYVASFGSRRSANPMGARHGADSAHRQSSIQERVFEVPQRLCYLNAMLHYLFSGPRFIFILSPLVYLILGRSNVFGYLPGILAYGLPHVFLSTVVNSRVHGKHRHSFWNEVYEVVLAPYIFLPTALALINPKWGKFNVTAKDSVMPARISTGRSPSRSLSCSC